MWLRVAYKVREGSFVCAPQRPLDPSPKAGRYVSKHDDLGWMTIDDLITIIYALHTHACGCQKVICAAFDGG